MNIVQMLTRLATSRAMNWGIRKGADYMATRGPKPRSAAERRAQRGAAARNRKIAQNLRRAIRLGRRL